MRLAALTAYVAAATLVFAAAGQAAQRYAAPEGKGGEPCAKEAPCSLEEAISEAKANDEVILGAGSYSPGATVEAPPGATNVEVHGNLAGPMPSISTSLAVGPISFEDAGGRLKYLDIENKGGIAFACGKGGLVERVRVKNVGASGAGIVQTSDCTVRDSLVRAEGDESVALSGASLSGNLTGVVRNITAIATGSGSVAIKSSYNEVHVSGSYTLNVKNSIASGEAADLLAVQGGDGPGRIVVSNSNFDAPEATGSGTVIDAGANQAAAPLFANAANGDYREAAGSPTIDAGIADQLGPLDLAGSPRVLGAAPDIGAFEFVPPAAPVAQIQSLAVKPKAFRAGQVPGAIVSRGKKAAVGATVAYDLSAAGTVEFSVERRIGGRRAGKKCVKKTAANKAHKKCALYKPVRGSFSASGAAGPNSFKFSGRLGGKPLKPGSYRLTAAAGGAVKKATFRIVK